jgi:hypothetical protein
VNKNSIDDRITALAPLPEHLDEQWAHATLERILADQPARPSRRARRVSTLAVAGILTVGTGAAVAAATLDDPIDVVRETLHGFQEEPNTTGNGTGALGDPLLVAKFPRADGTYFAFWLAPTSSGAVCYALTDADWDGTGSPSHLEYGCGGDLADPADPGRVFPLERPDQLGGYFKDADEPMLYGISPYANAVQVHVQGVGVDRTLPVRADSLGYGTAMRGSTRATSLTLTFLDSAGEVVGTRTAVGFDG